MEHYEKKNKKYFFFFKILRLNALKLLYWLLEKYIENNFSTRKTQLRKIFKKLRNTLLEKIKGIKNFWIFFTGSYQMSQAVSYLAEKMNEDWTITLQYVKIAPNIIKLQVRSRNINTKTYRCFVDYQPVMNKISGISRYCCDCANGRRTVGCYSHIAAIKYYLFTLNIWLK